MNQHTAKGQREIFEQLILDIYTVSEELGREVELVLQEGMNNPLSPEEAKSLLARTIEVLRRGASERADRETQESLQGHLDTVIDTIIEVGNSIAIPTPARTSQPTFQLVSRHGILPGPVFPRPWFHGREISMRSGFARTKDIQLWGQNERIDIHLDQFEKAYGRRPDPEELLDILMSRLDLPGIPLDERNDQFRIVDLARSIAVNGVRKPPILDIDGTLLDGNRRVAACYYILGSPDFDSDAKRRAEYIFCWQLTEYATTDERDAVVVSLNFEPDHKEPWPEYVKAKKVYDEWQAMLLAEPRSPGPGSRRQTDLKRALARKFALRVEDVTRYLKMVDWALMFEEYHTNERKRDIHEVQHRSSQYFQYFDEIAKGEKEGVASVIKHDEAYRELVFDLLFDGKFKKWNQIRDLKFTYQNEEALEALRKSRQATDLDQGQQYLEDAITIARVKRAETRSMGANTRIEVFVKWLEDLPVNAFRDQIRSENLLRLLGALRLVEGYAKTVLNPDAVEEAR